MNPRPDLDEFKRMGKIAHKCYGYILTPNQLLEIWKYLRGLPHDFEKWPAPYVMRNIGDMHRELWGYK